MTEQQQLQQIDNALQLAGDIPGAAADLTPADFARWKPMAERLAMAQHAQSEPVANAITQVAERNRDPTCLALAHWIHANVLYLLDQPAAAIPHYEQAEHAYTQQGDSLQIARLRIGKIGALAQLGQYGAALEQGQAAAIILQTSTAEADQNRLAALHDQIGVVSEFLGRYLESLDGYQRKHRHWQARLDALGAGVDGVIGEDAAERIAAEIELARASANIGVAKTRLGQFVEASESFVHARTSLAKIAHFAQDEPVWSDIARIDMNTAWLEMLRRSPTERIQAAFATAQHSRTQANSTGTDLIFLDLLEATWQLSQAGPSTVDETGAAHKFPPPRSNTETHGYDRQKDQILSANLCASVENSVSHPDETSLTRLRDRCEASGLAYETGRATLLLGEWLLRQDQIERAQILFEQVFNAALERGDAEIAHQAGLGWSRALQQAGEPEQAIQILEQTLDRVEAIQRQIVVSEFRAGFLEDKLVLYQELAQLHLAQQAPAQALQTVERAKARTLADMLADRQSRAGMTAQPEISDRSDLARALQQARSELLQAHQRSAAEQQLIERRITDLAREVERRTSPLHPIRLLALAELHAALPEDTLMLAYTLLQGQVWAFLIDHLGLLVEPICLGATPDEIALRQQLARVTAVANLPLSTAQRWAAQHIRSAQIPLSAWHKQFIAPLQVHLQRYARLIISPDGLLHHLPFACLWDADNGCYLIEQHEVLIAPSLQTWALLNTLGDKDYTPMEAPREALVVGCSCRGQLPHAVDEAHRVAKLVQKASPAGQTTLLIEAEATHERVIQAAVQAKLIYIATHGLFRADAPLFSYLELADGRLSTLDILNLTLTNATVVLSACETGLGHLTGNEMMGMVRAFLYAGARTVVATHWQVNDQATGQLMAQFVGGLLVGLRPGAILAQAQRNLAHMCADTPDEQTRRLWAHPYYWGGIWLAGAS